VREKVERFGCKVIRDHLIEQHRAFYAKLPFLVLGSRDESGQPWASILAERLWRFRLSRAIRLRQGLPMTFRFGEYSPRSLSQGDWQEMASRG